MKSNDKFDVHVKPISVNGEEQKDWVFVDFKRRGSWVPSFEDLFRIIRPIADLEEIKYPRGKGRVMVQEFLWLCCDPAWGWEALREKFLIPDRSKPKIPRG